jgi:hypothetical protein
MVHESEGYLCLLPRLPNHQHGSVGNQVLDHFILRHVFECSGRLYVGHHGLKLIIHRFDHVSGVGKCVNKQTARDSRVDALLLVILVVLVVVDQPAESGAVLLAAQSHHPLNERIQSARSIMADQHIRIVSPQISLELRYHLSLGLKGNQGLIGALSSELLEEESAVNAMVPAGFEFYLIVIAEEVADGVDVQRGHIPLHYVLEDAPILYHLVGCNRLYRDTHHAHVGRTRDVVGRLD